jgi:hypothetical protein
LVEALGCWRPSSLATMFDTNEVGAWEARAAC